MRAPAPPALLALFALLLVLPVASACSFAGEPPTPATFTLVPDDGSAPHELVVGGRMSGASCELSNPYAFDGTTFAWLETVWNPTRHAVLLYDVEARGSVQAVKLPAASVETFGLWDGKILYRDSVYGDDRRTSSFHLLDVATGEVRALPFPDADYPQVLHDGPRIVAIARSGPAPDGSYVDRLYVYDASEERFTVEGRTLAGLSDNGAVWMGAAGDGWIAFEGEEPTLYQIATGETFPMGRGPIRAIHGGYAWSWSTFGGGAFRRALPDGQMEVLDVKGPLVGFVPGHAVLGQFSPPGAPEPPTTSFERPVAFSGPGLGILLRVAMLLAGPFGFLGALFGFL